MIITVRSGCLPFISVNTIWKCITKVAIHLAFSSCIYVFYAFDSMGQSILRVCLKHKVQQYFNIHIGLSVAFQSMSSEANITNIRC